MIGVETEGGLWILRLNRPEKANALTRAMLLTLADTVERATAEGARALILTGSGKVFSAGADLDEVRAGLSRDPVWERLSGAIAAAPFLTIAALNGTLAGGASGMVLACDIRLAVPEAKYFYPVMRLGFLPPPSDPARLRALVGPARAKMILLGGAKITAAEARDWGLFDRLCDDPLAEARALAADVLAASADHATALKRLIP